MKKELSLSLIVLSIFAASCSNNNSSETITFDSGAVPNKVTQNDTFKPIQKITVNTTTNMLEKASWLIGSWKNNMGHGYSLEQWVKQSDSSYSGKSFMIVGKDTFSSEVMNLVQRGASVFYIPVVKGQNDNKPVPFEMTSATEKKLVFENPLHDFPQKITYTLIKADSILAEISGLEKGKKSLQQFPMKRIN